MTSKKGGIIIDPTKKTQYPVILSDELLGKASKETFTGVRYNHRPELSSELAPSQAYLKLSAKDGSYNLGFADYGKKYTYNGVRTSAEGKYVLVFDPAKKAFVLHRVDSLFHMNVVRLPNSTNADSLVAEFPRLEVKDKVITAKKPQEKKSQTQRPKGPPEDITAASTGKKNVAGKNAPAKAKPKAKPPSMGPKNKEAKQPQRRKKSIQNDGLLTLPDPAAAKAAMPPPELPKPNLSIDKKKRAEDSEEDDDDDDDGGLLVEYPDAGPAMKGSFGSHRAPLVPQIARPFSDFVRDYQEEADDDIEAEPEPELEDVYDAFNTTDGGAQQPGEAARALQPSAGGEHADWDGDAELEAELDAEFARAMQDDIDSESSVSEED